LTGAWFIADKLVGSVHGSEPSNEPVCIRYLARGIDDVSVERSVTLKDPSQAVEHLSIRERRPVPLKACLGRVESPLINQSIKRSMHADLSIGV
jgi:hypothetical protein